MTTRTRVDADPVVEPNAELDQIRQRLSSLDDPVAMLEGILAFSPLGLQIYKASGECLLVNKAFRRIFGSEPPPDYNVLGDDTRERKRQLGYIHQAFAGETVRLPPFWHKRRELTELEATEIQTAETSTEKKVAIEVTFFPLFDAAGAVRHVGVVFQDVTAEVRGQERAKREQEILREEHRLIETLYRIGTTLAAELNLERLAQKLADETTQLTRAEHGAFFYTAVNEKGESAMLFTSSSGSDAAFERLAPPEESALFKKTFREGLTVRIDDVTDRPLAGRDNGAASPAPLPEGHARVKSYMAVPVVSRHGQVLGALVFGHADVGMFTERDELTLVSIAAQAAAALDNARLYRETQAAAGKLKHSEEYYRLLAEAIPQIVWTANPDGWLDYFNQRWFEYTGTTLETTQGWGWHGVMHPEDVPRCRDRWTESFTTGDIYQIEVRFRRASDGSYRWFLGRALPVKDEMGRILKWFGTCTDIDDQKRSEREREELLRREQAARAEAEQAEQRFRFLAEASSVLSSSLDYQKTFAALVKLAVPYIADCGAVDMPDEQGAIRRVAVAHMDSRKAELSAELLRRHPASPYGAFGFPNVLRTGEPELLGRVDAAWLPHAAQDETHLAMLREIGLDAQICVPIKLRGRTLAALTLASTGSGRRYGAADLAMAEELAGRAALALDNSMLHAAEQTARWEAERAVSRVFRLQAITSALSEALTRSQVAEVAVEQSVAAIGSDRGILHVPSQDGASLEAIWSHEMPAELLARMQQIPVGVPAPTCVVAKTGEPVWIESEEAFLDGFPEAAAATIPLAATKAMACIPLHIDAGTVGALSLCFSEERRFSEDDRFLLVTLARQCAQALDRARLYEAERQASREAQAANRAKDEFLSVVSHELRTPLNAILGWSQILNAGADNGESLRRGLTVIERNAKAQVRIIEDILDVSRIITGKLRLEMRPLDVEPIVRAAMEVLRPATEAKHIDVTLDVEGAPPMVSGDADRLQQVVWNLLSNAIKFTPKSGRVEIRVGRVGSSVEISVCDNGKGIGGEFLPFVFDRFWQADSSISRGHGGLGLGLAIVRHLVEMHGGSVAASSAGAERGARFTVKLPVRAAKDRPNEADSKRLSGDALGGVNLVSIYGVRVVLVDDELDARELLTLILDARGAKTMAVASAAEALAAVESFEPDVLLSDIGMPGEDGLALIRRLRSQGSKAAALPAIALTAYASAEDSRNALSAGFQLHLSKPVEAAVLAAGIASLVGVKQQPPGS